MPTEKSYDWVGFYDVEPFNVSPISPSLFVLAEIPTGLINGVNESFTTAFDFQDLWVYLNGVRMKPGQDYNVTGSDSFQFLYPPQTGDMLIVDYLK